jgi:hypothetical protein
MGGILGRKSTFGGRAPLLVLNMLILFSSGDGELIIISSGGGKLIIISSGDGELILF